jgi:hypothetical protein
MRHDARVFPQCRLPPVFFVVCATVRQPHARPPDTSNLSMNIRRFLCAFPHAPVAKQATLLIDGPSNLTPMNPPQPKSWRPHVRVPRPQSLDACHEPEAVPCSGGTAAPGMNAEAAPASGHRSPALQQSEPLEVKSWKDGGGDEYTNTSWFQRRLSNLTSNTKRQGLILIAIHSNIDKCGATP